LNTTSNCERAQRLQRIDIPVARMAVLMDPQGAAFAILEPNYPEPR
jgi:hypothetical protein